MPEYQLYDIYEEHRRRDVHNTVMLTVGVHDAQSALSSLLRVYSPHVLRGVFHSEIQPEESDGAATIRRFKPLFIIPGGVLFTVIPPLFPPLQHARIINFKQESPPQGAGTAFLTQQ